jgi:hypothetical protein
MPIRLNLLAEAQAAELLRRRDPVKRVMWAAALLISCMLVWSSWLQLKATLAKSEVGKVEAQMKSSTNDFRQVLDDQRKTVEVNQKLSALKQLATNRFLNGTLLNALQQATVDDVELVHLRLSQDYFAIEEVKPRTNSDNRIILGKPGSVTEKIVLLLDGNDSSPNAPDQLNKFKEVLAGNPYFSESLAKTNAINLKALSGWNVSPVTGKNCRFFTLECRFPDKTR